MAVSPGGTHAESATLRTADGLVCHGVPAAFGTNEGELAHLRLIRAQPDLADAPLRNGSEAVGSIVLVTRGSVPFVEKARRVADAGAAGVVIVNSVNEPYVAHGHRYSDGRVDNGDDVTIPVVCIRLGDGSALARRLPCDVSLDFRAPELQASTHSNSGRPATELHTPPPLPRRSDAGPSRSSAAATTDVCTPVGELNVAAAATVSAGTHKYGLSRDQATFSPDALHSPAVSQAATCPRNILDNMGDPRLEQVNEFNEDTTDVLLDQHASEATVDIGAASSEDAGDNARMESSRDVAPSQSLLDVHGSPISPKQLAASNASAEARTAKSLAQVASESSAKTMRLAQQKERIRSQRNQATEPNMHMNFVPQARTSSEESFLAHERAAAAELSPARGGEVDQPPTLYIERDKEQEQEQDEQDTVVALQVDDKDGGAGSRDDALPSASTFFRHSPAVHTDAAANCQILGADVDKMLESPKETDNVSVGDANMHVEISQAKSLLRGNLRSRVRKQVHVRNRPMELQKRDQEMCDNADHVPAHNGIGSVPVTTTGLADAQANGVEAPTFSKTGIGSGVLRTGARLVSDATKGISFSARDQVAKFSMYDSPTLIYRAGEEPPNLQSPVSPTYPPLSNTSPAKTAFSLEQLEADNGGDAIEYLDEDEQGTYEAQSAVQDGECLRAQTEEDRTQARAESQGKTKRSTEQQERVQQRTKQQEILQLLRYEDSGRVVPVRRASPSAVAEIAIGSLRINATVAEFGLARGELPLNLQGVPVVRTEPVHAETAVTNNTSAYRGAVAVVRRGGGVCFAKKAKRVQDAGAVCCVIVNEEDRAMERIAAKTGDADARQVDIPVLCVPLCAGEALLAMLPGVLSVRIWVTSANKERSESQRTLAVAGGGDPVGNHRFSGEPASDSQHMYGRNERAIRKGLVTSLQSRLREMETAKKAAEASVARLEERLAGATHAVDRERAKQSKMMAALQSAEQAQTLAEEARIRAQEKARLLEEENERLIERLAHYAEEESATLKQRLAESRRVQVDANTKVRNVAPRSRASRITNNERRQCSIRARKQAAVNANSDATASDAACPRAVPMADAGEAVHQIRSSHKQDSVVSVALQQLHDAVEAQVLNLDDNDRTGTVAVEQHQEHWATSPTTQAATVVELTPDMKRELCGDGDRLVLRHVASVLATSPGCQNRRKSHGSPRTISVGKSSEQIKATSRRVRPLQSATNRHNATGWIQQQRRVSLAEPQQPQAAVASPPAMCGQGSTQSCKLDPNQRENAVHHTVHPSLHYNREGVAAVGQISEYSGPDRAEGEDWADHARRVASVLRGGHSVSRHISGKKGPTISPRTGSGWNSSVSVGVF